MQGISGSKNQTSADGIGFLYHTVGNPSFDPGLATALIAVAAPLLQQYLRAQSAASTDQAAHSRLDELLAKVEAKAKEQHIPANLLHSWEGLSATVQNTGYGTDNVRAWGRFQYFNERVLTRQVNRPYVGCLLLVGLDAADCINDSWGRSRLPHHSGECEQ